MLSFKNTALSAVSFSVIICTPSGGVCGKKSMHPSLCSYQNCLRSSQYGGERGKPGNSGIWRPLDNPLLSTKHRSQSTPSTAQTTCRLSVAS